MLKKTGLKNQLGSSPRERGKQLNRALENYKLGLIPA